VREQESKEIEQAGETQDKIDGKENISLGGKRLKAGKKRKNGRGREKTQEND